MHFKREIYDELIVWKLQEKRKPLLLMGARQIGKTTLLKEFGASEYGDHLYLNLEREVDVHEFFKTSKDPTVILKNLSLIHGREIIPSKTLLILDEIQECRDALIALKYFQEEMPDLHIIGAGSLLGLSIGNDRSFPVGKVEFLDMYPLSFFEYLQHADEKYHKAYHHFLSSPELDQIPVAFFRPLQELFKEYILIGGMPEVATNYLENRNIESAQKIQDQILRGYELDFVKHADKTTAAKIQLAWKSLPAQLAKENKKFIYKVIRSGARGREYEGAIQWLIEAGLVYKISKVTKAAVPLRAYEDVSSFKLYAFDTSLLIRLSGLDPKLFIDGDQFFTEFKGTIAENFVSQSLTKLFKKPPYYWTSDGIAELDFVIESQQNFVPIEVKSGVSTKAKSLSLFKEKYNPSLRVRISNLNLQLSDDLLNVPIFYAEYAGLLIKKALIQLE